MMNLKPKYVFPKSQMTINGILSGTDYLIQQNHKINNQIFINNSFPLREEIIMF